MFSNINEDFLFKSSIVKTSQISKLWSSDLFRKQTGISNNQTYFKLEKKKKMVPIIFASKNQIK